MHLPVHFQDWSTTIWSWGFHLLASQVAAFSQRIHTAVWHYTTSPGFVVQIEPYSRYQQRGQVDGWLVNANVRYSIIISPLAFSTQLIIYSEHHVHCIIHSWVTGERYTEIQRGSSSVHFIPYCHYRSRSLTNIHIVCLCLIGPSRLSAQNSQVVDKWTVPPMLESPCVSIRHNRRHTHALPGGVGGHRETHREK